MKQHPYIDSSRLTVTYRLTVLLNWANRNYWPAFPATQGSFLSITHKQTHAHSVPLLLQQNDFMIQVNKRPQAHKPKSSCLSQLNLWGIMALMYNKDTVFHKFWQNILTSRTVLPHWIISSAALFVSYNNYVWICLGGTDPKINRHLKESHTTYRHIT